MNQRKIKFQVTLSKKIGDQIEQELLQSYTSKSLFFEKVLTLYFDQKSNPIRNKKIELEI